MGEKLLPWPKDGKYLVSSSGRIFGSTGEKRQHRTRKGYLSVSLWMNGRRVERFVHAMVADTFIGEKPTGLQTNHINHNKSDNSAENLEYITPSENAKLGIANWIRECGDENPRAKVFHKKAAEIKKHISDGTMSIRQIVKNFCVSFWVVYSIKAGTHWTQMDKSRSDLAAWEGRGNP